ncbi:MULTISPECIES: PE-PPE domain-containing protein [Mycobacteriaceae]|uniref:PE-PPE domain-containing protein n=1 Tax=Mycolicibacterium parafortuitum TaxID=39692 RepID=A0ACC6MFM5_MYCPF|nr:MULTISPECIES: PE-PPE domain-containing protein [Mycobacteriaceae]MDZ5085774.1 PE-PPE domain-containing protein [Mycolicibacterium parafortuitum]GFM17415.1 PE-PPE domain-containing protein [Mycobacterium sp. PO1]GFM23043.1 PE-PPE domain-containing protein [Mycobacterium sp. PO2]
MRRCTCSTIAVLTAVVSVIGLWTGAMVNSAFAWSATALIMGGNSHPLSIPQDTTEFITDYVDSADTYFIRPSGLCDRPCALVAVYTPEEFRFVTGFFDMTFDQSVAVGQANLDECVKGNPCTVTSAPYVHTDLRALADSSYVIYGYSESATVASNQKLDLIAHPTSTPVSFLLLANPNRPNGGILERFVGTYIPILGVTFNGATPTFSPQPAPLTTVDVARQYDGWADFPTNPLNLLADVNALLGTVVLHGNYFGTTAPQLQGQYRDTTYYLIPTEVVPLLVPLTWIPLVGRPLAVGLDPALRVLIEMGYDRTVNPGEPTPARYLYVPDLVKAVVDFLVAIPTGVDNAISELTGDPNCRPLHTEIPNSPFGVGGPPVYTGAVDPYGEPVPYDTMPADTDTGGVTAADHAPTVPGEALEEDATDASLPGAISSGDSFDRGGDQQVQSASEVSLTDTDTDTDTDDGVVTTEAWASEIPVSEKPAREGPQPDIYSGEDSRASSDDDQVAESSFDRVSTPLDDSAEDATSSDSGGEAAA